MEPTDNSKHKRHKVTTRTRLWRILLLTKRFDIETELSLEECVLRLRSLSQPTRGFLDRTRREVDITRNDDTYEFTVRAMRYREATPYTTASASGVIVPNEGLDKTVVRGEAELSATHLICIAVLLPAIVFFNTPGERGWLALCVSLFIAAYSLLMWLILFNDRNRLIRLIREELRDYGIANASSGKKKKNKDL